MNLVEAKVRAPRPINTNTGSVIRRTLTPKRRPKAVESYTCGRMRVPPIFAEREGNICAIGKISIPRVPDQVIREIRRKPPRSYKSYKPAQSNMGKKLTRNAQSVMINGLES